MKHSAVVTIQWTFDLLLIINVIFQLYTNQKYSDDKYLISHFESYLQNEVNFKP